MNRVKIRDWIEVLKEAEEREDQEKHGKNGEKAIKNREKCNWIGHTLIKDWVRILEEAERRKTKTKQERDWGSDEGRAAQTCLFFTSMTHGSFRKARA